MNQVKYLFFIMIACAITALVTMRIATSPKSVVTASAHEASSLRSEAKSSHISPKHSHDGFDDLKRTATEIVAMSYFMGPSGYFQIRGFGTDINRVSPFEVCWELNCPQDSRITALQLATVYLSMHESGQAKEDSLRNAQAEVCFAVNQDRASNDPPCETTPQFKEKYAEAEACATSIQMTNSHAIFQLARAHDAFMGTNSYGEDGYDPAGRTPHAMQSVLLLQIREPNTSPEAPAFCKRIPQTHPDVRSAFSVASKAVVSEAFIASSKDEDTSILLRDVLIEPWGSALGETPYLDFSANAVNYPSWDLQDIAPEVVLRNAVYSFGVWADTDGLLGSNENTVLHQLPEVENARGYAESLLCGAWVQQEFGEIEAFKTESPEDFQRWSVICGTRANPQIENAPAAYAAYHHATVGRLEQCSRAYHVTNWRVVSALAQDLMGRELPIEEIYRNAEFTTMMSQKDLKAFFRSHPVRKPARSAYADNDTYAYCSSLYAK